MVLFYTLGIGDHHFAQALLFSEHSVQMSAFSAIHRLMKKLVKLQLYGQSDFGIICNTVPQLQTLAPYFQEVDQESEKSVGVVLDN